MFEKNERLSVTYNGKDFNVLELDSYVVQPDGSKVKWGLSGYAADGYLQYVRGVHFNDSTSLPVAPFTETLASAILQWPEEQVTYQTPMMRERIYRLSRSQTALVANANLQREWKKNIEGFVFDHSDIIHTSKEIPKPYQLLGAKLALNAMENFGGYSLFMDMGTGKTFTSIIAIDNLIERNTSGEPLNILILLPTAVKTNWENELEKFSCKDLHVVDMNVSSLWSGTDGAIEAKRLEYIKGAAFAKYRNKDAAVFIGTFGTVANTWEAFAEVNWDLVICDEGHQLRNVSTKRTRSIQQILPKAKNRLLLTGSPFANSIADLYMCLEFCGPCASGFASYGAFRKHHLKTKPIGHGVDVIIGTQMEDDLKERIALYSFSCLKSEVLKDLPQKTWLLHDCDMAPDQKKAYHDMASVLLAKFEDEQVASTEHVLTQLLRLAHITAGFVTLDGSIEFDNEGIEVTTEKKYKYFSSNSKITQLGEWADELPQNEKMVIWNCWRPMVKPILDELARRGHKCYHYKGSEPERSALVEKFNSDPECRFFLANPRSAGTGINLLGYKEDSDITDVTEHVRFSYTWSFIDEIQSEDRSNRVGSRRPLRIRRLIVPKTIDKEIFDAIKQKRDKSEDIRDIKDILERLCSRSTANV